MLEEWSAVKQCSVLAIAAFELSPGRPSADSADRLSITMEGTDATGGSSTATISGVLNSRAQLLEFTGQNIPTK